MKCIFILTLILISPFAYSSPAEEPPDNSIPILDTARELLGARANFAANRLDSFFATERADDEFGRSRIRIRSNYQMREGEVGEQDNQYRINLKLPHLEDKFKFDYYQDEEDKKKEISKAPVSDIEERERLKSNRLLEGWIFNSDVGVTAAIPPRLTVRARLRKNFVTGTFIHRFVEQLTYRTDESGLVEETRVESDHSFNTDLLFRFVNSKEWEIQNENFRTDHGPTVLHRVSEDDAFRYSATLQTRVEEGIWFLNNYRLAVNYRHNLYKQFVYFEVTPGLDFPKNESFRREPFITFQLEFLFGG